MQDTASHFSLLTNQQCLAILDSFDVQQYAKKRNFVDGTVSKLSPYLTLWIISPQEAITAILQKYSFDQAEKFVQELTRKEFFQHVVFHNPEYLHQDEAKTQTDRVNTVVSKLKAWRLHNHERMRLASRCTHVAQLHRKKCADWTYYYFLDWDLWPNHLSRQRVQSTFANKPYIMNSDNLQKYSSCADPNLDMSYEELAKHLFDTKREYIFSIGDDAYSTLLTPYSDIAWQVDIKDMQDYKESKKKIVCLSPRDFHHTKIEQTKITKNSSIQYICVIEKEYFDKHPRSKNRIAFLNQYINHFGISSYIWSIHDLLEAGIVIHKAYEQIRPIYMWRNSLGKTIESLISYNRLSPVSWTQCIPKFFSWFNKSKKHIKDLANRTK